MGRQAGRQVRQVKLTLTSARFSVQASPVSNDPPTQSREEGGESFSSLGLFSGVGTGQVGE